MSGPSLACDLPHLVHHLVRGQAGRFVDDQDAIHNREKRDRQPRAMPTRLLRAANEFPGLGQYPFLSSTQRAGEGAAGGLLVSTPA